MPLPTIDTNAPDHPQPGISLDTLSGEENRILMRPRSLPFASSSPDQLTLASNTSRTHLITSPSISSGPSNSNSGDGSSNRALWCFARCVWHQAQSSFELVKGAATSTLDRFKKHGVEAGMVGIGIFSAYFYARPASEASEYLVDDVMGLEGTPAQLLKGSFVVSCVAVNALLGAQCLFITASRFFARNDNPSYTMLCPPRPRRQRYLERGLTVIGAIGFSAPPFALTLVAGGDLSTYVLAGFVAFANFPIGYVGVENLMPLLFGPTHSSCRTVFLSYLDERNHDLYTLYENDPNNLVPLVQETRVRFARYFSDGSGNLEMTQQLRSFLEDLLTLPLRFGSQNTSVVPPSVEISMVSPVADPSSVTLINATPVSLLRMLFQYTVTGIAVCSSGGYIWSALHSLPWSSPAYIAGDVVLAGLSSAALLGLSGRSGLTVGRELGAGKSSLAHSLYPTTHQVLRYIILGAASLSGGSNFMVNKIFVGELLALLGAPPKYQELSGTFYGSLGIGAAPIVNFFFSEGFLNMVLELVAQYRSKSDPSGARAGYLALVSLCLALHKVCSETSEENFMEILKGLVVPPQAEKEPETRPNDALSNTLIGLFRDRLSTADYQTLRGELGLPEFDNHLPSVEKLERSSLFKKSTASTRNRTVRNEAALEDSDTSENCFDRCFRRSSTTPLPG